MVKAENIQILKAQLEVNQLSSSIKELRRAIKEYQAITEAELDITLPGMVPLQSFSRPRLCSLTFQEENDPVSDFEWWAQPKSSLRTASCSLLSSGDGSLLGGGSFFSSKYLRRELQSYEKEALLEQLVGLSKELLRAENESFVQLSDDIASRVNLYRETSQDYYLSEAIALVYRYHQNSLIEVKVYEKRREAIYKKIFIRVTRDIRQSFRLIIRFLFKNMDSDKEDSEKLYKMTSQQLFRKFLMSSNNGYKGNNRLLKWSY